MTIQPSLINASHHKSRIFKFICTVSSARPNSYPTYISLFKIWENEWLRFGNFISRQTSCKIPRPKFRKSNYKKHASEKYYQCQYSWSIWVTNVNIPGHRKCQWNYIISPIWHWQCQYPVKVTSMLTIIADHQLEDHKTKIHFNFHSNNYLKLVATCLQMMTYSKIVSTSLLILWKRFFLNW